MRCIDRLKETWVEVYDPKRDAVAVIEKYFHPNYKQCINGVIMFRPEYIQHVLAQKQNMHIEDIEYLHCLEHGEKLFAIYYPKGKNSEGTDIKAEVISYFQFQEDQIINVHGQVRFITGTFSDADMQG